ncbi:MAG: EAL domain-containing protein [Arenimonas sp.]
MGFRFRLASFLVAALVSVQVLTAVLVYSVTRHQLIDEGKRQLGVQATAFGRQLDDLSERVATSVQVLALDYALRSAIAQRDQDTLRSALGNHGRRVGATRMQLIGTDGRIEADTLPATGEVRFAYQDLLERSFEKPAAGVVSWHGRAYWVVAVPVFAPDLVGVIAATLPVDDALIARLQNQSVLPKTIELVGAEQDGWRLLASGGNKVSLARTLGANGGRLPTQPRLLTVDSREYLVQAVWLNHSSSSPEVAAVLAYSVDEALQPYRAVGSAWAALLGFGLLVGVLGATLIARRVSKPVEELAASARRIAAGDYSATPTLASGDEIGALASAFASMSAAIQEREARILHQANHDQVTGLPNRVAAETAIQRERMRNPASPAALLVVGLRRVPEIVKTMGHAVADRMMRNAGERLSRVMGDAVARATDTSFSVYLPGEGKAAAIASAYRVIDALSAPYQEADLSLDIDAAVGVALSPEHGLEAATLLRRAGVALITALGTEEPVVVYDPGTDPHRPERLSLMSDLREALDRDQLELHYQPKLNLATGLIDGAEALVRWQHPRLGNVPPDSFIALAEETGNIRRLTRWAIATGIAQAHRWNTPTRAMRISINVSARDLDDADLPRRIAELLALHQVDPARILLEVTESAVMDNPDAAIRVLRELSDQGIDLAIDDFGVGQSSFAYLRQLPVTELKIDKVFTQRIQDAPEDRTIVRSIVELGHHLGYKVTAEGVDNAGALQFLADVGCDHAQGFLIARALPSEALERLIDSREWVGIAGRRSA